MVYNHADESIENILDSIGEKIKNSQDLTATEKSDNIISYLNALKIKWEVELWEMKQQPSKFAKEIEQHENRMASLNKCINEITENKSTLDEWMKLFNIRQSINHFNRKLGVEAAIIQSVKNTNDVRDTLSWLQESYIVPSKKSAEKTLSPAEPAKKQQVSASKIKQFKTSVFSLFDRHNDQKHQQRSDKEAAANLSNEKENPRRNNALKK